jgi:hypothetical protein
LHIKSFPVGNSNDLLAFTCIIIMNCEQQMIRYFYHPITYTILRVVVIRRARVHGSGGACRRAITFSDVRFEVSGCTSVRVVRQQVCGGRTIITVMRWAAGSKLCFPIGCIAKSLRWVDLARSLSVDSRKQVRLSHPLSRGDSKYPRALGHCTSRITTVYTLVQVYCGFVGNFTPV